MTSLRFLLCMAVGLVVMAACQPPAAQPAPTQPKAKETQPAKPQAPAATPTIPEAVESTPQPKTAPPQPTVQPKAPPAQPASTPPAEPEPTEVEVTVQAVATGLETIWALAFLPDGRLLATERAGRVRLIDEQGLRDEPVITLPAQEVVEAGLMGLAVDPDFPREPHLYAMYTYAAAGDIRNRVVRLRMEGDTAEEERVLMDDLPAARIHDGGRVKFGPDGMLYFALGDVAEPAAAQDPDSPAGKILRLNRDGSVPADNPFPGSPVYSLGHRNPQGMAWHPETGDLYSTEHGAVGNDEVNLIEPGENYGWPQAEGPEHPEPFVSPLAVYSPAIAPAGATFYDGDAIPQWRGSFFFATLRGNHLHRLVFDENDPRQIVERERLYEGEYGRLRDVVQGPDGALYVSTSNRDGRGSPAREDDRILRIAPR